MSDQPKRSPEAIAARRLRFRDYRRAQNGVTVDPDGKVIRRRPKPGYSFAKELKPTARSKTGQRYIGTVAPRGAGTDPSLRSYILVFTWIKSNGKRSCVRLKQGRKLRQLIHIRDWVFPLIYPDGKTQQMHPRQAYELYKKEFPNGPC